MEHSCSGHGCDCVPGRGVRRVGPYAAPLPVQLWSARRPVRTRVAALLGGPAGVETAVSPAKLYGLLRIVLPRLSASEAADLMVVHRVDDGPDRVEPALGARHRMDTPWLPGLLDGDTLHPWFQPIVDLGDGTIHGREALLRAHDGRLLVGTEIVEAARAHGEVHTLDQVGRAQAIRQGGPVLPAGEILFINFLPTAIYEPTSCLRTTWAALSAAGLEANRVCFEVAESEKFPDIDHLLLVLDTYRAEGARVALDDLGAGWMSLNYVRELRPDVVKLDRELVRGLSVDPARERLVAALVEYAHELGILVVAEGIETLDDLSAVRRLGTDLAQGHLLGSAQPAMDDLARAALAALAKAGVAVTVPAAPASSALSAGASRAEPLPEPPGTAPPRTRPAPP